MILTFLAWHGYYKTNFSDSYLIIYFLADSQKHSTSLNKQIFDAFLKTFIFKSTKLKFWVCSWSGKGFNHKFY